MGSEQINEELVDEADAMLTLTTIKEARTHAAAGRHGQATALLMQALRRVPPLADELEGELTFSLKAYGEHLAAMGQPNNALWLYSEASTLLKNSAGLVTNLGGLYYSLGKAGAAIRSFKRLSACRSTYTTIMRRRLAAPEQALELKPRYWPALESLENVKSLAVDRWHFRMLNHSARNEAYSRAIGRAVTAAAARKGSSPTAGVTVLDIGTGTGILAVMAARAGASRVFACEVNEVLCEVAREVVGMNGVADRVTVINKSSGALQPGVDVPLRGVDVIVTELVDSGLLGERIIPVLVDARARGLLAEGGRVIPEGARVYGAIMESDSIRRRSRLLPGSPAGLRSDRVSISVEESYTCEDLSRLEHRLLTEPSVVLDVDFLRDGARIVLPSCSAREPRPRVGLEVRETGRADAVAVWFDLWLDEHREDERDVISTRPERSTPGDSSGWDAGIYFSHGMELGAGRFVALDASVARDRLCFDVGIDADTRSGDTPSDQIPRRNGDSGDEENDDMSDQSLQLGEQDLARLNDDGFHSVFAMAVKRVLDKHRLETLAPAPGRTSHIPTLSCPQGRASRKIEHVTSVSQSRSADHSLPESDQSNDAESGSSPVPRPFVLSLCGAWSVSGLLIAQLGHEDGALAPRVLALVDDEEAAGALNALARENGIGPGSFLASSESLANLVSGGSLSRRGLGREESVADWFQLACGGVGREPHDSADPVDDESPRCGGRLLVLASIVEGSGLLRQGGLGDLELCRRFLGTGRQGEDCGASRAEFLPGSLDIVCCGLQKASLLTENRVFPDDNYGRYMGVDLSPLNSFGVRNFRELDLSRASQTTSQIARGSESRESDQGEVKNTEGARVSLAIGSRQEEVEAFLTDAEVCYELDLGGIEAGMDSCLPRRSARLRIRRNGVLHAIAYWFRQRFRTLADSQEDFVVDTGPSVETEDSSSTSSHFRQAAVLLHEPLVVTEGQIVDLVVFCTLSQGVVFEILGVVAGGDPPSEGAGVAAR